MSRIEASRVAALDDQGRDPGDDEREGEPDGHEMSRPTSASANGRQCGRR